MGTYDIDKWFEEYLKLVGLNKLDPKSAQYIELKRSFVAAIGMFIVFVRVDGVKLGEANFEKCFESIQKQVKTFYVGSAFNFDFLKDE